MKKVLLVATVQSHIAQFHKPLIRLLQNYGYEVHVAAKNNLAEKRGLDLSEVNKLFSVSFSRNPFSVENIKAYHELREIIKVGKYDIVHCNTPVGGVLTRMICKPLRKTGLKVIYTAHGFHFYKGAPLINWLIYYPLEKYFSSYTDILITINKEDYQFSNVKMKAKRNEYIPGVGVDVDRFSNMFVNRVEKRKDMGIPQDAVVIVSVGEINKNKNHQLIIKALERLNNKNVYYVLAGNGPLRYELEKLVSECGLNENVHFLGYTRSIPELFKVSDIFCFPSIREGLGLAAIEAMASGLPIIATENRGTRDFILDNKNGILCENNIEDIVSALKHLMENPDKLKQIAINGQTTAKMFDVKIVERRLKDIYDLR